MPFDRPTRVAFVGDPQRFSSWALPAPVAGVQPAFVAAWADDARRALEAFGPDVVVVLDVDDVPAGAYAGLGARVLGVAAPDDGAYEGPPVAPVAAPRPPLRARAELAALGVARRVAPASQRPRLEASAAYRAEQAAPPPPTWDRLVALDRAAARGRDLWRLLVPPVDDRLFADARRLHHAPRVLVAQPSTAYRERLLITAKHEHDVRHVAHGITPDSLPRLLADTDVAIVVRAGPDTGFDHGVALHAAAGHLVICDHAAHGLEPGTDVLQVADDRALAAAVGAVRSAPDVHFRIRVRGRLKAEAFRASRVWPNLVADLLADLEAFGPSPIP
jgi:hypothetical protein